VYVIQVIARARQIGYTGDTTEHGKVSAGVQERGESMLQAMLLSHLLGDYVFQGDRIAAWKNRSLWGVLVHGGIVSAIAWLCSLLFLAHFYVVQNRASTQACYPMGGRSNKPGATSSLPRNTS